MALGFEKMERGSLGIKYTDRAIPMQWTFEKMNAKRGFTAAPPAPQMFGNAGREYMERYGVKAESFARIAEKNHRHSAANPRSQFRDVYTLDEILAAPMVHEPLTKLQCCPTSDGGAAAILASEEYVREHGLADRAVEIVGMAMNTDFPSSFESDSDMRFVGFDMTRDAARQVYEQSGHGPEDVDVIELHDCFSANEMITYEGLGLCGEGGRRRPDRLGRRHLSEAVGWSNPSGGLISKGTRSARRAWRSAPSSPGSCATRPRSARSGRPPCAPAQPRAGRSVRSRDVREGVALGRPFAPGEVRPTKSSIELFTPSSSLRRSNAGMAGSASGGPGRWSEACRGRLSASIARTTRSATYSGRRIGSSFGKRLLTPANIPVST